MLFKKKKEEIKVRPTKQKKRSFIIPEIVEEKKKKIDNSFTSSIFGSNVKNETVLRKDEGEIPVDKRYDAFRTKKVLKDYSEFNTVNSSNSKEYLGRDTKEYEETIEEKFEQREEKKIEIPFNMEKIFHFDQMSEVVKEVKSIEKEKQKTKYRDEIKVEIKQDEKEEVKIEIKQEEKEVILETKKEETPNSPFGSFNKKKVDENVSDDSTTLKVLSVDEIIQESAQQEQEEASERTKINQKEEMQEVEKVEETEEVILSKVYTNYEKPPMSLLNLEEVEENLDTTWVDNKVQILDTTFEQFRIDAKVSKYQEGPSVTRFEIVLGMGVPVKKITSLEDTIKMNLAATDIRIEAPIPGKNAVGIEIPNIKRKMVTFGSVINTEDFYTNGPLSIGLGLDIDGNRIFTNIATMPHGLIAGSTGSGKSVCINTLITSLIMKNSPSDLRLLLIDPKMVELVSYNNLPHLVTPVITDPKMASQGLKWAVEEMERRYKLFADNACRNLEAYNKKAEYKDYLEHTPYIVIIVDELADLMMIAGQDVEDSIQRITQKARAAGIHLLVATQRPSTDVVKGTIKTNIPSRIAFSVATYVDSMTIIDRKGAETLLGRGDMLIIENGKPMTRVQGAYLSDDEIDAICDFIRDQGDAKYLFEQSSLMAKNTKVEAGDDLFEQVSYFVVTEQTASMNRISKRFGIGFNRAQSLVEMMASLQIVGPNQGSKAREILINKEELDKIFNK